MPLLAARASYAFIASLLLASAQAKADDKDDCIAAHTAGQALKLDGKLRKAQASFVVCAGSACPSRIQNECARWLEDVGQSLPTVVIQARDERGADTTAVAVIVDGERVAEQLTGSAIPLDPGEHALRFEGPSGRVIEQRLLLLEGEKNRKLSIAFAPPAPSATLTARAAPPPPKPRILPREVADRGPPASMFVFGAVSLAALAGFAVVGITGKVKQSELEKACAPNCSDAQFQDMYTRFLVADISLGVSVIAFGVAAWIGIRHATAPAAARASSAPPGLGF